MLTSISPLGERARAARWWRTTSAYVVSSVVGGAALGAVLGAIGALLSPSRLVVAVAAGLAVAGALLDSRNRVPTWHRQVDENWLTIYRDWVYGAGFGAQLGLGAVTIVTSAVTYLTWVLELAAGRWSAGLAIGGMFGLARALPLLSTVGVSDPAALRRRHARMAAATGAARGVTVAGQLVAAGTLAAIAGGAAG